MILDYTAYLLQQTRKKEWPYASLEVIDEVTSEYYQMAVQEEVDPEDKNKKAKAADSLRNKWYNRVHSGKWRFSGTDLTQQIFEPTLSPRAWTLFPEGTFYLHFKITLAKPLITRDDRIFYVIENPVAKDPIFRCPIMRSSSWKGVLRYAMRLKRKQDLTAKDDDVLVRLFGPDKKEDSQEPLRAGRLNFFTTFFDAIGLEVLNPHIRERKVGTQPIAIECVPVDSHGEFYLLYTPFDLLTTPLARRLPETYADLEATVVALRALMTQIGFSAKRTSGYGVIYDKDLAGQLWFKQNGKVSQEPFNDFAALQAVCEKITGGQKHD